MVDLWADEENQASVMADRRSAPDRPSYFDENWRAAQENAEHFANSNFSHVNRTDAINDKLNEIYDKTGVRIPSGTAGETAEEMVGGPNQHIEKLRKAFPDIEPLDPKQIDALAQIKALEARQHYQALGDREQTWGGFAGSFLGGMYGGFKDPLTIATLGIAPSHTLGIVKTAIAWGTIAGTQRAVNEVANATERENIDPGYIASGEPYRGIIEAFGYGALWGAGPKAVSNVWQRFRHGDWPTGIRDAGNHVMSEAQIDDTNTLAGARGEAVHRQALAEAAGQVERGEPVRVHIDPEVISASRDLTRRLEGEAPHTLPIPDNERLKLTSEAEGLNTRYAELDRQLEILPEGKSESAELLTKVKQVESELAAAKTLPERRALETRRDELLTNTTPEKLAAEAGPIEQRRTIQAQQANIETRLSEIEEQIAKGRAKNLTLGDSIKQAMVGQRQVVGRAGDRRHWMATEMSMPTRSALVQNTTPEKIAEFMKSPEHLKAIRSDMDREVPKLKPEEGTTRFYHGGDVYKGGPRWLTPDLKYAKGYAEKGGGRVHYVDIPNNSKYLKTAFEQDEGATKVPFVAFEAPEEIARGLRPHIESKSQEMKVTVGRPGEEVTKPLSEHLKDIDDLAKGADEIEKCYIGGGMEAQGVTT